MPESKEQRAQGMARRRDEAEGDALSQLIEELETAERELRRHQALILRLKEEIVFQKRMMAALGKELGG